MIGLFLLVGDVIGTESISTNHKGDMKSSDA